MHLLSLYHMKREEEGVWGCVGCGGECDYGNKASIYNLPLEKRDRTTQQYYLQLEPLAESIPVRAHISTHFQMCCCVLVAPVELCVSPSGHLYWCVRVCVFVQYESLK